MDGNHCGTLTVCWLFESFERSSECDGRTVLKNSGGGMESMPVDKQFMDTCVYNVSESFVENTEGEMAFSSPVHNSSATLESVNELRNSCFVVKDVACTLATSFDFSSNMALCEAMKEPASAVTLWRSSSIYRTLLKMFLVIFQIWHLYKGLMDRTGIILS